MSRCGMRGLCPVPGSYTTPPRIKRRILDRAMDDDVLDEVLDPAVLGGLSEHILDDQLTCTLCNSPLGYSTDDQPYWPTGPMCGNCYQAQQMDDEIWMSEQDNQ